MKTSKQLFLVILLTLGAWNMRSQTPEEEKGQQENHQHHTTTKAKGSTLSPHTDAMAMINGAHIHIDYSSPGVRDRIIFGGLVGYNTVWQAGAHMATWIETDKDLEFKSGTLPAGKYGLFLIPRKDQPWSVIFNSRWEQHGKDDYNEAEDILRLEVQPGINDKIQESLTYEIVKKDDLEGILIFSWEKKRIELPFRVK